MSEWCGTAFGLTFTGRYVVPFYGIVHNDGNLGASRMHIEIKYADGVVETIPVRLANDMVMSGQTSIPGIDLLARPSDRVGVDVDFFLTAHGEGGESAGFVEPFDDDDTSEAFHWRLVGSIEAECEAMLRGWVDRIGHSHFAEADFDLGSVEHLLAFVPAEDRDRFRDEMRVVDFYCPDAAELVARITGDDLEGAGPRP